MHACIHTYFGTYIVTHTMDFILVSHFCIKYKTGIKRIKPDIFQYSCICFIYLFYIYIHKAIKDMKLSNIFNYTVKFIPEKEWKLGQLGKQENKKMVKG